LGVTQNWVMTTLPNTSPHFELWGRRVIN
jgi:hypothetical protein